MAACLATLSRSSGSSGGIDMRYAIAVLIGLHGARHLVGFAAKWQLISSLSHPYQTSIFGVLELKDTAIRLVGLTWLGAGLGCVLAGSALWDGAAWSFVA